MRAHHPYTAGHMQRVGRYAGALAGWAGKAAERATCERAGALHDLGKLDVPVAILDKPGKLDAKEWAVVREHPEKGAERARATREDPAVVDGILHHHERVDGTGYPDGLKGEAIPWVARVVSVADTWDAVTTKRSYQPARDFDAAVKVMRDAAGTQLDAALVQEFIHDPARLRKLTDTLRN